MARTSYLMVAFHRALFPAGRAGALQQAQLTLLKVPGAAHPYYWRPFSCSALADEAREARVST